MSKKFAGAKMMVVTPIMIVFYAILCNAAFS
ncbi:MAG: hypothetical protein JWR26_2223 [Pedosphaera sp.]|nr:hypothetical protein [Pedosphaera sp.]